MHPTVLIKVNPDDDAGIGFGNERGNYDSIEFRLNPTMK